MTINDKNYPLCSKIGVLRRTYSNGGEAVVVSTTALREAIGWSLYKTYLPYMKHANASGPTPASCEEWLRTLKPEVIESAAA